MARRQSNGLRKNIRLSATFIGACVVGGVLAAGLVLPAVGAAGLGAQSAVQNFDSLPDDFKTPPLSQASTIYDAAGGTIATVYDRDRTVVPSDQITPMVKTALVDIEDNRFYQHGAIDLKGVLRALSTNANAGGTAQGGSTLTQQYVKNVFVDEAGDDQAKVLEAQRATLDRKIKELKYAIRVEETLSKDQILTNYLNITFFGERAYGIEAASERYFSAHAKDLTLPQAALLAGLVQSPSGDDPIAHPTQAKQRRDTVLRKMAELGHITEKQAQDAIASQLDLTITRPHQGCITAQLGEGFFCDYVHREMLSDPAFGKTPTDRQALWNRGGLQIRTTLDPTAQKAVQNAVSQHTYASDKPAAVMTVVQPGTGRILAMGQSRPYGLDTNQTQINLNVPKNMGGGLGFPTGSTFKPIVAAAALEDSIPPSRSYTTGYSMPWPAMTDCSGGRYPEGGEVHNDATSLAGTFTMPQAMAKSVNTYFASLEAETGLCNVAQMANKLGITQQAGGEKLGVVPSMTLGTNDLTPLEMSEAYAAFAAHGMYCSPSAITSVTGPDGRSLAVPQSTCSQAMSATTADYVTAMLKGVVQDGTGTQAGLTDRENAGKTGTTNDGKQVWFVGYTPEMAGATVVGDTVSPKPLEGQQMGGDVIENAFGGTVAGPIWRDAMNDALAGVPAGSFTQVQLPQPGPDPGNTSGPTNTPGPTDTTSPTDTSTPTDPAQPQGQG
ncbi:transglycosylase domain-containing protein [Kitasatospora sp. GP82]|uniref:transglycosylase domain-containing protein n=1 Tax=Kitasatospora sp. GP82 TaxID=3035089 RepID=UPI002474BF40|nr:transglycosylase domain-containing protein [Kitasatospora sp. GP82]MDH6127123.1 membrane peptidoglycan carboxypeptidase [Kitasatospora sp. GP82]